MGGGVEILWVTLALATDLVVDSPEAEVRWADAARGLWAEGDLVVTTVSSRTVPRFEVVDDVLHWVTERGVASRVVEDAESGVLLIRSWSASPDLVGGWTALPEDEPMEPVLRSKEKRAQRTWWLDRVGSGFLVRMGTPARDAGSTLLWNLSFRKSYWVGEVVLGGRNIQRALAPTQTTFTGMGLLGWSPSKRRVRPLLAVAFELKRTRERLENGRWTAYPVAVLGLEVSGSVASLIVRIDGAVEPNPFVRLAIGPRIHF